MDANDYAALGWPIFPVRWRSKEPLATLARHGYKDASTDVTWRRKFPNCNIGLECSPRSGLIALDVDPRAGGDDTLAALVAQHGPLPATPIQLTSGGGLHYIFKHPGTRCRNVGPGLDVKADGYIVVEPSLHPSGYRYMWDVGHHPTDTPLAAVPLWLLGLMAAGESPVVVATGDAATSLLGQAFAIAGRIVMQIDSRRVAVRCPMEHMHTSSAPSSTVIMAPTSLSPLGLFHCSHSHPKLSARDVLSMLLKKDT